MKVSHWIVAMVVLGFVGAGTAYGSGTCSTLDLVDIGDPTSESGHAMAGWGPVEPATSGGNYGGIDNCRPVYAPEDNDNWATIDLNFGTDRLKTKCLTMHHLDGIACDSFEVYIYPTGRPDRSRLIYTYTGDGLTSENWYKTSISVTAIGIQTLEFVSTAPKWAQWSTYGQMCFDTLLVEECDLLQDEVDIGDPTSEGGHTMVGWGPIEPATSGGNYGGIDDCRAIYAPEDNDDWACIDMDFGDCFGWKCVTLDHLDGIAKDAFEVYLCDDCSEDCGTLVFTYDGNDSSTEIWLKSSFLVETSGVKVLRFVSTEPTWAQWSTYGQVCFDRIRVEEYDLYYDYVDIGDPTSESGHGMAGWGPIEPATSGGNYGGVDDCRPIYAPEDNDVWATIDIDFGRCAQYGKALVLRHLDGLAVNDAFEVYIYPPGHPESAQLIYTYFGDGLTSEIWYTTSVFVDLSGVWTVKLVSTEAQWSGWATYGQVCFDWIMAYDPDDPMATAVESRPVVSRPTVLQPMRPTPFRSETALRFHLPTPSRVDFAIYDVRGRLVREIQQGTLSAGDHMIVWDGADSRGHRTPGVYFYRVQIPGRLSETGKIVLVK